MEERDLLEDTKIHPADEIQQFISEHEREDYKIKYVRTVVDDYVQKYMRDGQSFKPLLTDQDGKIILDNEGNYIIDEKELSSYSKDKKTELGLIPQINLLGPISFAARLPPNIIKTYGGIYLMYQEIDNFDSFFRPHTLTIEFVNKILDDTKLQGKTLMIGVPSTYEFSSKANKLGLEGDDYLVYYNEKYIDYFKNPNHYDNANRRGIMPPSLHSFVSAGSTAKITIPSPNDYNYDQNRAIAYSTLSYTIGTELGIAEKYDDMFKTKGAAYFVREKDPIYSDNAAYRTFIFKLIIKYFISDTQRQGSGISKIKYNPLIKTNLKSKEIFKPKDNINLASLFSGVSSKLEINQKSDITRYLATVRYDEVNAMGLCGAVALAKVYSLSLKKQWNKYNDLKKTDNTLPDLYFGDGIINQNFQNIVTKATDKNKTTLKIKEFSKRYGLNENMHCSAFRNFIKEHNDYRIVVIDMNIIYESYKLKTLLDVSGYQYEDPIKMLFIGLYDDLSNNGHYVAITHIIKLLEIECNFKDVTICKKCLAIINKKQKDNHICGGIKCEECSIIYKGSYKEHIEIENIPWEKCDKCERLFKYKGCHKSHICKYEKCENCKLPYEKLKKEKHKCYIIKCKKCFQEYSTEDKDKKHICYIQKINANFIDFRAEIESDEDEDEDCQKMAMMAMNMWVFDFESYIDIDDQNKINGKEIVNYISTRSVYTYPDENGEDSYGQRGFRTLHEFVLFLKSFKENAIFIAHNGSGYDFILLHAQMLDKNNKYLIYPKKELYVGNKLYSFKYGKITFIDSYRHIAASLSNISKSFGLPISKSYFPYTFYTKHNINYVGPIPDKKYFKEHLEDPEFHKWYDNQTGEYDIDKEMMKYCDTDVEILAQACDKYSIAMYKLTDRIPFAHMTIGQLSLATYRESYMPIDSIPMLDEKISNFCHLALKGGRVEVFKTFLENCNASYYDVNSLYPTVMLKDYMPGDVVRFVDIADVDHRDLKGFIKYLDDNKYCAIAEYNCKYNPEMYYPVLGVKGDKLTFPLGTFKGIETCAELRLAYKMGYVIEIQRYVVFKKRVDLFKDYIEHFYEIKEKCDKPNKTPEEEIKYNKVMRSCVKLILNNLWGKFAQKDRDSKVETLTPEEYYRLTDKYHQDPYCKIFDILDYSNDWVMAKHNNGLYNKKYKVAPNRNYAIACFVTSHARRRLYEISKDINRDLIYQDTDSLIINNADKYIKPEDIGTTIGLLKDELGGEKIVKWVCPCPKVYGFITDKGNIKIASKGFYGLKDFEKLERVAKGEFIWSVDQKTMKKSKRDITIIDRNLCELYGSSCEYSQDTMGRKNMQRVITKRNLIIDEDNNYDTEPLVVETYKLNSRTKKEILKIYNRLATD